MMLFTLALALLCFGSVAQADPGCVAVAPASDFANSMYAGLWYEVGKIQTEGGASFQENCWCDTTDFMTENLVYGDGEVTYSCRLMAPDGEINSATANLFYDGLPGHFKQQFPFPFAPKLDYTIIYIDEDTAVEYDCGTDFQGVTNYCVHFMSRVPTLDEAKLQLLIEFAESLGLNNQNVTYKATKQEGCW